MPRAITKFTFPGSQGAELAARLDLPEGAPRAYALFAHCFTCSKDIAAASRISAGLVDAGIGVLRFDFTGLGASDGEFANTNFTSNVADIVAAADALRRQHEAPSLLIGHSLGGAAVLAATPDISEVTGVVTIAAPSEPAHVEGVFDAETLDAIERDGEAEVCLAGRSFRIRRQFLDDIANHRVESATASLDASLLVLHSPVDELVGVEHARRIYERARHPKSFVSLDRADHLLTDHADAQYVASLIAAWVTRYLPTPPDELRDEDPPVDGEVVVAESGTGAFAQSVRMGRHVLQADEPLGIGDDTGPNPYDLLLASLGACTSMTIRMYARRKGIALDHVEVRLAHERRHCDDCGDPDAPSSKIEVISRRIELSGDLTDEQVAKLRSIADRCPVHRTLTTDLRIETELTTG